MNNCDCKKNYYGAENIAKLPPYHTFKAKELYFLFDTSTMQFYKISKVAYMMLQLCKTMTIEQAKNKIITYNNFTKQEIEACFQEIKLLIQAGFMESSDNYIKRFNLKEIIKCADFSTRLNGFELSLSNVCNLACKYCYCSMAEKFNEDDFMSAATAKKAIDMLIAGSLEEEINLTLFGGEPLLNKKVIEFIMEYAPEAAKKAGKKIHFIMTTNGTLVDDKIIEYILKYNFGLMVSLDGDEVIHNSQCPTCSGEGSFDDVLKGVKKILEKRKTLTVRATLTHPVTNIKKLIDFFTKTGFTRIVLGPATAIQEISNSYSFDKYDFDKLANQEEDMLPDIIESLRHGKIPAYFCFDFGLKLIANGAINCKPIRCSASCTNFSVATNGDIFPCHRFNGMSQWKLGSLESGIDIGKCRDFWLRYNDCIKDHCGNCWAYPFCNGPCPWELIQYDGSYKFNDMCCRYMKLYAEKCAYLFFCMQETFIEENSINELKNNLNKNFERDCI